MNVLLDTQILIWSLRDDSRLSKQAKEILNNPTEYTIYISVVSIWEIRIKQSIGKLNNIPPNFIVKIKQLPIEIVRVSAEHAYAVRDLPFYHKDPFDRLLVAQSQIENMTILTSDENVQKYDVSVIKV